MGDSAIILGCFSRVRQIAGYNDSMSGLTVEIIPDSEQGGFTARVPDIPAYGEGDTEEQALADLREALIAYIEAFGLADAMARLDFRRSLPRSGVDLLDLARA